MNMLSKFARDTKYPPGFRRRLLRNIPPDLAEIMEFHMESPPKNQYRHRPSELDQVTHNLQKLKLDISSPGCSYDTYPDATGTAHSEIDISSRRVRARRNKKRQRELVRKMERMEALMFAEGLTPTDFESDSSDDIEYCINQLRLKEAGETTAFEKIRKRRRKRGKGSRIKHRLQAEALIMSKQANNDYYRSQPMPGMGGHHHQGMMINGPRGNGPPMNGPPMNGPMGNPMGPHMMSSPNGPMHGPIPGPIPSPHNNIGPSPMSGPMQGNGPINGPMMSPMGPMNNGGPLGPMNSPLNGPMNGPINGPGPMNGMSSPMNGPMSNPINGMGGGMNSPMGGPSQCPMNHVSSNAGGMNNNFMMPMNNIYQKPLPVSAGKVYPADQPMVFNSQNPNAPPIYPCGVCHKEVHDNDQAILCESGCNFWFHRGCTGLTEAAFQLLTAEVYAEWVCDKCLASKNIPLVKFKP